MVTLRASVCALFVLLGAGFTACEGTRNPSDGANRAAYPAASAGMAQPGAPPWLEAYDQEQQRLLALPTDVPVQAPTSRVFPDLGRFTFTGEAPIRVPDDPQGYANLVVQALNQSPLLYVFRSGPETLANVRALYGPAPAPEPDPWRQASVSPSKEIALVSSLPSPEARDLIEKAKAAQPAEAVELLRKAAAASPTCPGVHAMLGDAALAADDAESAESAGNEILKIDPMFPSGHRILAEAYLKRAKRDRAKDAVARALALYPGSKRAWQVAAQVVGHEVTRDVDVPQPFLDVSSAGAVVVVTCDRPFCERYAGCKAAFRYEPTFRAAVLNEASSVPYHLSVTEEVVCLQAGLGAHIEASHNPQIVMPDPKAELLLRLAREKGLTSYAMFEIIGRYRPEWLRVAPASVHEAVTRYVLSRVFGPPAENPFQVPASTGTITAGVKRVPSRGGS